MTPRKERGKTYWHLKGARRIPSEYELVTSRLHYYQSRGIAVNVPAREWYERYQKASPLQAADWEGYADPQELTYTKYTAQQKEREALVDELLARISETGMDQRLSEETRAMLERTLPPLRYALHGLQMAAAYVGHIAPASRITISALMQTADEVRRIQRCAYRMRQLQQTFPGFGDDARIIWQMDPMWQPLRRTIETLLVTYDWGEAFTALNLVVKPYFDDLFFRHMSKWATAQGDYLWAEVLVSLQKDGIWHRRWSAALARYAVASRAENRQVLYEWVQKWQPNAQEFFAAFSALWGEGAHALTVTAERSYEAFLLESGVHPLS